MQFARSMLTEMRAGRLPGATANARFLAQDSLPTPEIPAPKQQRLFSLHPSTSGKDAFVFNQATGATERRKGVDIARGSRGGRGGRVSVFEQKRQAFLSVFPGDMQGALEFAQGRRSMNDTELQLAAQRLAMQEARGAPYPGRTPEEIDQRARELFELFKETSALGRTGGASSNFTPDPNAGATTPPPSFTPVPGATGAPRSEGERPGATVPRASRRPKVGDTVTSNGRQLRVTKVLGGGRVEVEDPATNERFTARVK